MRREGIDTAARAGDNWALVMSLISRAFVAHALSEPAPQQYAERALSIAREELQPVAIALSLSALGMIAPDPLSARARRCYEEALEVAHEHGDDLAEAAGLYNLAAVDLEQGRYEIAQAPMIRLLHPGFGDSVTRAFAVRGLGFALAGRRTHHDASRLIAAGDAEIERLGMRQDPSEADLRNAALARIEAAIGRAAMDESLREGRCLQISDAVGLAPAFPTET